MGAKPAGSRPTDSPGELELEVINSCSDEKEEEDNQVDDEYATINCWL